ncbi:sodium:solute symporter family protein [bacterium]|nr:sodium:solute symporter family protein [bacterium]
MNWISLSIVILYILLLYVITWATRKLSKGGMIAYLLAGRGFPTWVVAAMLTGLAVGGASTIGVAEKAFSVGISAGWYNAAWAFGALMMGFFVASRYRNLDVCTLPEFFEKHYSAIGRILGVIGQLIIQIVITSLQYVAGGAILSQLLPDIFSLTGGIITSAFVFFGISFIGGLWAAGLTNVLNVIIIYVGIIIGAFLTISKAGGLSKFQALIPPTNPGFDLTAIGEGIIIAMFITMTTTVFATQSVVQISFAGKDGKTARNGFILGGLLILPVGFISAIIGLGAAIFHPGIINTEALPKMVLSFDPIIAGLILAGLWAADVSTACGLLLGSTTLIISDIIKRFIAHDLDEVKERWISKVIIIVISILTLLLALTVRGILKTLLIGLTLNTPFALITLMTIFLPSLCRKSSATWTLLATMIALACWLFLPSLRIFPDAIYFTWVINFAVFFLVLLFEKRKII